LKQEIQASLALEATQFDNPYYAWPHIVRVTTVFHAAAGKIDSNAASAEMYGNRQSEQYVAPRSHQFI